MRESIEILLVLIVLWSLIVGSDFSFSHWLKDKKKYTEWYFNREKYEDFLKILAKKLQETVHEGMYVKVAELSNTKGMLVLTKYSFARRIGVTGTVLSEVPGYNGTVWYVEHDKTGKLGAYHFDELLEIV